MFTLVTTPVITSQTVPTNQIVIYGNHLSFSVTVSAPGQFNGFPIGYRWQSHGTNIPGANTSAYSFYADDTSSGIYSVIVTNAAGSASATWWVTVTNLIEASRDLLVIYNTNSADSIWVKDYYLAHRSMVSGANVLGIGCTSWHSIFPEDYTNTIAVPVQNWLTANPTKRPQYVILMAGIPWRVNTNAYTPWGNYQGDDPPYALPVRPSVQYQLSTQTTLGWQPFVTGINMGELIDIGGVNYGIYTNACKAYIDKLEFFGTNYSSGKLAISASAGGYGNTNLLFDNVRYGSDWAWCPGACYPSPIFGGFISNTVNTLQAMNLPDISITYVDGLEVGSASSQPPHITNAVNVAGYMSWGEHSLLTGQYATTTNPTNRVWWQGNSSWYLIETIESFNGQPGAGQGDFFQWFSAGAFGGTNYANTPIGVVTHVDEPGFQYVNNASLYFGLWASGKNFGVCGWVSRRTRTDRFQAVGDPFVTR